MAEFQEVMRQLNRMCNIIDKTKFYCTEGENGYICPMRGSGLCSKSISNQTDSDWKDGEKIIMSWAAEHPEPVYPTWGEWLMQLGVMGRTSIEMPNPYFADAKAVSPIPADIAQKLGIEPKEAKA